MVDNPQYLADRLREEGERVVNYFRSLSEEQWKIIVYSEKNVWSMHHLLAHFVSSEISRKMLIVDINNFGYGAPSTFDIDTFNQHEVELLSAESHEELLERFIQERATLVNLVDSMSIQDFQKIGCDPFLGEASILDMIKLTYRHLQIHLRDARRCL